MKGGRSHESLSSWSGLLVKWNHSALSRRSHGVRTRIDRQLYAGVAQRQEAIVLGTIQCQFESDLRYHLNRR